MAEETENDELREKDNGGRDNAPQPANVVPQGPMTGMTPAQMIPPVPSEPWGPAMTQPPAVPQVPAMPNAVPLSPGPAHGFVGPTDQALSPSRPSVGRVPDIPGTIDPRTYNPSSDTGTVVQPTLQQEVNGPWAMAFTKASNIHNPLLRVLAKIGTGAGTIIEGMPQGGGLQRQEERYKEALGPGQIAKTQAETAEAQGRAGTMPAQMAELQARTNAILHPPVENQYEVDQAGQLWAGPKSGTPGMTLVSPPQAPSSGPATTGGGGGQTAVPQLAATGPQAARTGAAVFGPRQDKTEEEKFVSEYLSDNRLPDNSSNRVVARDAFQGKGPIGQAGATRLQGNINALPKMAGFNPGAFRVTPDMSGADAKDEETRAQAAYRDALSAETQRRIADQEAVSNRQKDMTNLYEWGKGTDGTKLTLDNAPDEFLVNQRTGMPIPQKMVSALKPSMQETNRSDFAKSTLHGLDVLDGLRRQGKLPNGPVGGLTKQALAHLGLGDEEAQDVMNLISFNQTSTTGAHVGGRFNTQVLDKMSGLINIRMNTGQLLGAEEAIRTIMEPYMVNGGRYTVEEWKSMPPEERSRTMRLAGGKGEAGGKAGAGAKSGSNPLGI